MFMVKWCLNKSRYNIIFYIWTQLEKNVWRRMEDCMVQSWQWLWLGDGVVIKIYALIKEVNNNSNSHNDQGLIL